MYVLYGVRGVFKVPRSGSRLYKLPSLPSPTSNLRQLVAKVTRPHRCTLDHQSYWSYNRCIAMPEENLLSNLHRAAVEGAARTCLREGGCNRWVPADVMRDA